jgi:hypothetical protein
MRAVSSALLNLFLMTLTTSDESTSYGDRRDSILGLVHKIRAGRPTNCGLIPGWEKQFLTTRNRPDGSGAHPAPCGYSKRISCK